MIKNMHFIKKIIKTILLLLTLDVLTVLSYKTNSNTFGGLYCLNNFKIVCSLTYIKKKYGLFLYQKQFVA